MASKNRLRVGVMASTALVTGVVFSACGSVNSHKVMIVADDAGGTTSAAGSGGASNGGNGGINGEAGEMSNAGQGGEMTVPEAMPGAPFVIAVSPVDKFTMAAPNKAIQVKFSEPMDPKTITLDSVQVQDSTGTEIDGAVTYSNAIATFTPTLRMDLLGTYTVSVSTAVTDVDGTPMAKAYTSTFTIREGLWGLESKVTKVASRMDNRGPRLASDGKGHAIAVWAQYASTTATTYDTLARFFTQGTGWGEITTVSSGTVTTFSPQVAMNDGGDAVVAWIQSDPTITDVVMARRYVGGVWDKAPIRLDTETAQDYVNAISVGIGADGSAHVAWIENHQVGTTYYYYLYARDADPTGVWSSSPRYFTSDTNQPGLPAMAFDSKGDGFAIFTEVVSATQSALYTERFLASSGTWSNGGQLSGSLANSVDDPAIALDDAGGAMAVWVTSADSTNYSAVASQYAKAWKAPVVISDDKSSAFAAGIAATGKGFVATWTQGASIDNVYENEYRTTWGTPSILTSGDHAAFNGVVRGDAAGNALVVWQEQSGVAESYYDIHFARLVASTDKWSDPALVENSLGVFELPRLTMLPGGCALAVWSVYSSPFEGQLTGFYGNVFE